MRGRGYCRATVIGYTPHGQILSCFIFLWFITHLKIVNCYSWRPHCSLNESRWAEDAMPGYKIKSFLPVRNNCSYNPDSALAWNEDDWMDNVLKGIHDGKSGMGLVSGERKKASILLSKAAIIYSRVGDFVETGTYTGGSTIALMKVLMEFDRCGRLLWAFDSFQGLPATVEEDRNGPYNKGNKGEFKTDQRTLINNLKRWRAYDEKRIRIVPGFFNETTRSAPIKRIAFLRLDGDLFSSTWDALQNLYDKVIPGGLIYVDDYGSFNGCKIAIDRFRKERGIGIGRFSEDEKLNYIYEWEGRGTPDQRYEAVWWRKRRGKSFDY